MNVFAAPAGCSLQANFIQSIFAPINVLDSSFLGRSRLKGLSQESKCICVKTVNVFVSRVWMYLCSHQHWLAGLLWAAARSKIKSSIASLPPCYLLLPAARRWWQRQWVEVSPNCDQFPMWMRSTFSVAFSQLYFQMNSLQEWKQAVPSTTVDLKWRKCLLKMKVMHWTPCLLDMLISNNMGKGGEGIGGASHSPFSFRSRPLFKRSHCLCIGHCLAGGVPGGENMTNHGQIGSRWGRNLGGQERADHCL